MQFKDLPECAQHTACNLLSGIYQERTDKTAAAKEIRDAFIALYSAATIQDSQNELLAKKIGQLTGAKGLKIKASIHFLTSHAALVETTVTQDGKIEDATSVIVTCISKEQEGSGISEEHQTQEGAHHQWGLALAEVVGQVLAPLHD